MVIIPGVWNAVYNDILPTSTSTNPSPHAIRVIGESWRVSILNVIFGKLANYDVPKFKITS